LQHYCKFNLHNFLCFQDIARKIEKLPSDRRDKPTKDIVISDSGALDLDKPFVFDPKVLQDY